MIWQECGKGNAEDQDDILTIINSYDVPKFTYCADKKKFLPTRESGSILCGANDKALIYRNRLVSSFLGRWGSGRCSSERGLDYC
jgi:hypothetical protein